MSKIYYHGSNTKFDKFDKSKIKEDKLDLYSNFTGGINESIQSIDTNTYVIDNTEQLLKHLKRKSLAQRIIYDKNKDWYLVSSNDQLTHPLIVEQVYHNGFYGFDVNIYHYIDKGYIRQKGSNTQKPVYLYNFLYTPNTEIFTNFFDGIDHAYSYDDFGCIYTKGFDIMQIPLGENLKEPQQIKENYMTELQELLEKLNKFVIQPVDKSFDEMEDETGMNKVQEEFKIGDIVRLRGQNRKGKISKIINDEVVEIEFPAEGNRPARNDRYYKDELKLSESIMDDVSKKTQEDWSKLNQRYEELKDLNHQELVDKLMQKDPFKDEVTKNFFDKQTDNNLLYKLLAKEFSDWQVGVFFKKKAIDINEEASFSALGTAPTPGVKVNGNPVQGKSVKKMKKDKFTVSKINKMIESYIKE